MGETRQRHQLREEQEVELQESIMMDQMREQKEKEEREEQEKQERSKSMERKRKVAEEESNRNVRAKKEENLPAEPAPTEAGSVDVMVRVPDGKRLRRLFRDTDRIGHIYDYLDITLGDGFAAPHSYRLVQTMP